ncbi:MAG: hypothetical protein GXP49_18740 [Deltaproteobacteria bacterium]|nr:hypothetical protein [Deltaproteobacteria bacterium]
MRSIQAGLTMIVAAMSLASGCSYNFDSMNFPCAPMVTDAENDVETQLRCPPGYYCSEKNMCLRGECANDQECKGDGEFCIDHKCVVPEAPELVEADAETDAIQESADDGPYEEAELELPQITGFTPAAGPVWSRVEIGGANFAPAIDDNEVRFHVRDKDGNIDEGLVALVLEVSDSRDRLLVRVPENASGKGPISVKTPKGEAMSDDDFEVTDAPSIKEFDPKKGVAGTEVTIKGYNFSDSALVPNKVSFNGVAAPDGTGSTTEIKTTVPVGATTGPIEVQVGDQSGQSEDDFEIIGPPTIDSFFPVSGFIGERVTVYGSNFDADTPANNQVSFQGAQVPSDDLLVVETDRLVVKVPQGAKTGPISVSVGGQNASSADSFTVTEGHPASGTVAATVDLGNGAAPAGLAVSADNRHVYVAAQGTDSVLVIDGDKLPANPGGAVVSTIPVALEPTGVATTPDGKFVLVTNTRSQQVWILDETKTVANPDNCMYSDPIQALGGPEQIGVDPTGNIAVVLKNNSAKLTRIDLTKLEDDPTHSLLGDLEIKLGSKLVVSQNYLDFSDAGDRMVLTGTSDDDKSYLVYFDMENEKVKNSTPLGTDLKGVALSPDGVTSYAADFGEGAERVSKYNHLLGKLSTWISIPGCRAHGLAKTPDGTQIYITCVDTSNGGASKLYRYDTASNTQIGASVPLCAGAFTLAFSKNGSRAYVSCFMENKVVMIQ